MRMPFVALALAATIGLPVEAYATAPDLDAISNCPQDIRTVKALSEDERNRIVALFRERLEREQAERVLLSLATTDRAKAKEQKAQLDAIEDMSAMFARQAELRAENAATFTEEDKATLQFSIQLEDAQSWGLLENVVREKGWLSEDTLDGEFDPVIFLVHPVSAERSERLICLFFGEVNAGRMEPEVFARFFDKVRIVAGAKPLFAVDSVFRNGEAVPMTLADVEDPQATAGARKLIGLDPLSSGSDG